MLREDAAETSEMMSQARALWAAKHGSADFRSDVPFPPLGGPIIQQYHDIAQFEARIIIVVEI